MPAKKLKVAAGYAGTVVSVRRGGLGSGWIRIKLKDATPQQLKILYDLDHPSVEPITKKED